MSSLLVLACFLKISFHGKTNLMEQSYSKNFRNVILEFYRDRIMVCFLIWPITKFSQTLHLLCT